MAPDVKAAVAALLAEGFSVVPIVRGQKNPNDRDWLHKTYGPDDFAADSNVGVKCGKVSNWRVDVDMDAPEAVRAGQRLLFKTDRIHGREGKPSSHWWFTVPGAESKVYKDLDGTTLIEIRSDGGQTVVPPSIHTSGQAIAWIRQGASATLAVEDLVRSVSAVGLAALFARHWPRGSRHIAAGHLAGFLLRLGFDEVWTANIIETAATIAGDDEVKDRVRIAKDTARKHAAGEKTTGGPKLAETFERGKDLAARAYEWFDREGDDVLDELNERHFVARLGSDMVVATEHATKPLSFQSFDQFRQTYYNRYMGKTKLGEWWLAHPLRRTFDDVVFAPQPLKAGAKDYNLWQGFAKVPDDRPNPETRCEKYLLHLLNVICDGNKKHFAFLMDVLALSCQEPGRPSGVVTVLRGHPGAGKGTFVELFGSLFGRHYMQIDKQRQIVGQFNAHLSGKVVVFADEAFWAGNKQDVGALRRLITERTITVEHKYRDAHAEPNCIHLFMATNEEWVYPASLKERRGFILDVSKKTYATEEYFNAIYDEWEAGGAEAFLALCLQRSLATKFLKIPTTAALVEQQVLSHDPMHQWWLGILLEGRVGLGDTWPSFISCTELFDLYVEEFRQYRGGKAVFGQRMKALLPPGTTQSRKYTKVRLGNTFVNDTRRGWDIPGLDACRRHFDLLTGVSNEWPAIDTAEQLSHADAF